MNGSLKLNWLGQTNQRHPQHRSRLIVGVLSAGMGFFGLSLVLTDIAASQPEVLPAANADSPSHTELLSRPTLKSGSQGAEVTELQATLKLLGFFSDAVNGVYGETTVAAVSRFQQAAGLSPDGIVGPVTWNRLFPPMPAVLPPTTATSRPTPAPASGTASAANRTTPKPSSPTSATNQPTPSSKSPKPSTGNPRNGATSTASTPPELVGFPILRVGMQGPAVAGLQQRLRAIGTFKGATDGVFGNETQAAVRDAQRKFKLEPDGVVGPATWSELMQ